MTKALGVAANFPAAVFADGRVSAYLKQDDAAKARFEVYLTMRPGDRPERLAPPFVVTAADGQRIAMDDLTGKVLLIDFWATWCEPCRAALPHVREIAKKFRGSRWS
jgi:thiol-disulfide isomerase/thioredoxin